MLKKKHTSITMMIALEVDDAELITRLLNRGKDSGRPDDQNEAVISKRIVEYNSKTAPLKNYYTEQGKFHGVKGVGSIEEIFNRITSVIEMY